MTTPIPDVGFDLVGSPYLLLNLFLTSLLAGLVLALLADSYIDRGHKRIILIILLLSFSLIVQTVWEYRISVGRPQPFLRTVLSIYGYCVRPALVVLVFYIIADGKKTLLSWILTGINAAVYLTALFSPVAFQITQDNRFYRGPLGFTCHIVTAMLMMNLVCLTVRDYGRVRRQDAVIPIFNSAIIAVSVVLDCTSSKTYPVSCLNTAIVISCALYYIWLHLQFVREHERALQAEQRIQIMLSQIQPHFIFNTLGAIRRLCRDDPEAREAIGQVSLYLRGNMDSLSLREPVPFTRELEHTKAYLDLEQLRFGDELTVVYDLECTGFLLPTLTLQPLVENAVRHGVRAKESGTGTVTVATREKADCYEISVSDDGPGFDAAEKSDDGRSHIGLENVRERLKSLCGGDLRIESARGEGSRVTIVLPKEWDHADIRH